MTRWPGIRRQAQLTNTPVARQALLAAEEQAAPPRLRGRIPPWPPVQCGRDPGDCKQPPASLDV